MTIQAFKICCAVLRKKRLGAVLSVCGFHGSSAYLDLQEALPPRSLVFGDDRFDADTSVSLSTLMLEEYDRVLLKAIVSAVTILLSAAGVAVAVFKP